MCTNKHGFRSFETQLLETIDDLACALDVGREVYRNSFFDKVSHTFLLQYTQVAAL